MLTSRAIASDSHSHTDAERREKFREGARNDVTVRKNRAAIPNGTYAVKWALLLEKRLGW